MAIQLIEKDGGKTLHVGASGKLSHEDYKRFIPEFERLIDQHGKIRILFEMTDFHGWDAAAVWDDFKMDLKHFADIEKIAMVGDKKWEKNMSVFCKPFTTASVRYFDQMNLAEAEVWLSGRE